MIADTLPKQVVAKWRLQTSLRFGARIRSMQGMEAIVVTNSLF